MSLPLLLLCRIIASLTASVWILSSRIIWELFFMAIVLFWNRTIPKQARKEEERWVTKLAAHEVGSFMNPPYATIKTETEANNIHTLAAVLEANVFDLRKLNLRYMVQGAYCKPTSQWNYWACASVCVLDFLHCPCVAQALHINSLVARTDQSTLILQSRHVEEGMFFSLTLS